MKKIRFGIVVSRFNAEITEKLLASCLKTLRAHGMARSQIQIVQVPGAFEIPWAAQELAQSGKYRSVICLGAILKGETTQNAFLAQSTLFHLQRVSLKTRIPCILGVITPDNYAQALARTKGRLDRGREAALAALELAQLKIHNG